MFTLLRQSGNVLDIAQAVCRRCDRIVGFVNQCLVHLFMKGLCRVANSCKPGLLVGAVLVACNGLRTAARFDSIDDHRCCLLGCSEELDCLRHLHLCSFLFHHLHSLLSGTGECIPPKAIFRLKKEQIAVRSDRLCILVSGLVDAFVTAFNRNLKFLRAYVW